VASGVLWSVADGIVEADLVDGLVPTAAVRVIPQALGEAMEYRDRAINAYYLPPGSSEAGRAAAGGTRSARRP
jgi:hypothetical protein